MKSSASAANVQRQLLVPELVTVHPVPASMWYQLVLLPSLLYRCVTRAVVNAPD